MIFDSLLTSLFSGMSPVLGLSVFSFAIILILNIPYRFWIDQRKVEDIKFQQKELAEKMKESQARGEKEEVNKHLNKTLELNNQMFKMMLKPMALSFFIAFLFLPWAATFFKDAAIKLPFAFPWLGDTTGWVVWYIIVSVPSMILIRKLIGIKM